MVLRRTSSRYLTAVRENTRRSSLLQFMCKAQIGLFCTNTYKCRTLLMYFLNIQHIQEHALVAGIYSKILEELLSSCLLICTVLCMSAILVIFRFVIFSIGTNCLTVLSAIIPGSTTNWGCNRLIFWGHNNHLKKRSLFHNVMVNGITQLSLSLLLLLLFSFCLFVCYNDP